MGNQKPHLLIVDDEPLNRELLRRVLGPTYELSEAGDGGEAIEVLEEESGQIRLVLCDYLMPGMNGVELAELVKERWPNTPFLLLTGYDEDDEIAAARDKGLVHSVITKPWRSKELRAAIADKLES